MSFLSPFFLFALAAIGLPLVIHLLNLRKPKRIQFSTLAFFKELQKSTIRKIRLKRWLLLALRVFAIACLALVLARPFLPPVFGFGGNTNQPSINAILVDNSISMERVGAGGPLFDQAREIVQVITSSAKAEDRFLLQKTNGASLPVSMYSAGQTNRRLDDIEVESSGGFAAQRLNALIAAVAEAPYQNKKIFLITDQPALIQEMEEVLAGLPESVLLSVIRVEDVRTQNTFVSEIGSPTSMVAEGVPFTLQVAVKNAGETLAANQFLTLEINGETSGQYPLQLDPGEIRSFEFELNPGAPGSLNGKLIIEGDEFSSDNEYYFTIEVPDTRKVLWVNGYQDKAATTSYTGPILEAPQNVGSQLDYEEVHPDELSGTNIREYDVVILDGLNEVPEYAFEDLRSYVQEGNSLMFFPSETGDITNYNDFLELFNAGQYSGVIGDYASFVQVARGTRLLEDHPVFRGLFDRSEDEQLSFTTPDIYYYLGLRSVSSFGYDLITLNNGDVLFREKPFGQGKILVSAIGNDPGWSNFPIKALYAPFYYRSILYAASGRAGGFAGHILGNPFEWTGDLDAQSAEIVADDQTIQVNNQNLGGSIRIEYGAEEWVPGWIHLQDTEKSYSVAVNLDAAESDFASGPGDIAEMLSDFDQVRLVDVTQMAAEEVPQAIQSSGFGQEVWHWFMMAGLLFLLAESLVSIFYKAETIA